MLFLLLPHGGAAGPPRSRASGLQAAHPRQRQGVLLKLQRETSVSRCRQCVNVSSKLLVTASGWTPSPGYQRTGVSLGVFSKKSEIKVLVSSVPVVRALCFVDGYPLTDLSSVLMQKR